ncbi:MAG: flagellar hook-basal body complex protein [Pseudomonadota bacterium]
MEATFATAQNGLYAANQRLQVNANNMSNLTTDGFKAQMALQGDVYHHGTRFLGTADDMSIGAPEETGDDRNFYIQGEGFFEVATDGEPAYTRVGNFTVDRDGNLVTPTGHLLEPNIVVPEDSIGLTVTPDGVIASVSPEGEAQDLGQLQLARFLNPNGLLSIGNNLYVQGPDSGDAQLANPGDVGFGTIMSRYLEGSNVDPAAEITQQIVNQRSYQMNLRVFQTSDSLVGRAIDLFS